VTPSFCRAESSGVNPLRILIPKKSRMFSIACRYPGPGQLIPATRDFNSIDHPPQTT
jgi:hypothetical protein